MFLSALKSAFNNGHQRDYSHMYIHILAPGDHMDLDVDMPQDMHDQYTSDHDYLSDVELARAEVSGMYVMNLES